MISAIRLIKTAALFALSFALASLCRADDKVENCAMVVAPKTAAALTAYKRTMLKLVSIPLGEGKYLKPLLEDPAIAGMKVESYKAWRTEIARLNRGRPPRGKYKFYHPKPELLTEGELVRVVTKDGAHLTGFVKKYGEAHATLIMDKDLGVDFTKGSVYEADLNWKEVDAIGKLTPQKKNSDPKFTQGDESPYSRTWVTQEETPSGGYILGRKFSEGEIGEPYQSRWEKEDFSKKSVVYDRDGNTVYVVSKKTILSIDRRTGKVESKTFRADAVKIKVNRTGLALVRKEYHKHNRNVIDEVESLLVDLKTGDSKVLVKRKVVDPRERIGYRNREEVAEKIASGVESFGDGDFSKTFENSLSGRFGRYGDLEDIRIQRGKKLELVRTQFEKTTGPGSKAYNAPKELPFNGGFYALSSDMRTLTCWSVYGKFVKSFELPDSMAHRDPGPYLGVDYKDGDYIVVQTGLGSFTKINLHGSENDYTNFSAGGPDWVMNPWGAMIAWTDRRGEVYVKRSPDYPSSLIGVGAGKQLIEKNGQLFIFSPPDHHEIEPIFSRNGRTAVVSIDQAPTLWNIETGRRTSLKGEGRFLAYAPDEKNIFLNKNGEVRVYNLERGEVTQSFTPFPGVEEAKYMEMFVSPDGTQASFFVGDKVYTTSLIQVEP